MTIFGKPLSAYVGFAKVFLVLILVVGAARLALSLAGVSNDVTRWLSINGVIWVGIVVLAIRAARTGFGTYRHLLPPYVLQMVTAQMVIVPAIILAIVTGRDNVFSAPEFSFG